MEDDSDIRDGAGSTPDSLLPYDKWTEAALRGVVSRAIAHAATEGLPGQHHFYITFRTDFPGVSIPPRLRQKYPEEMTIVLQHQFHNLHVDDAAGTFGVSLSFGGVLSPLVIPLTAVTAFVDPQVQYGLRFGVSPAADADAADAASTPPPVAAPAPAATAAPPAGTDGEAPQVVSLDAFRRKRD